MRFRNGFLLVVLTVLSGCASTPPPIPLSEHDAELELVFNFPRHGGRLKFQFEAIDNGKKVDIGNVNLRTNNVQEHTRTLTFKKPDQLEGFRVTMIAKSTTSLEAYYCTYVIPVRDSRGHYFKYQLGQDREGIKNQCWARRLK